MTSDQDGAATGPLRDRTIIVLGATGPVGGAVARRLLAEGANVIAQGRDLKRLARLQGFGASTVQGDMRLSVTRSDLMRVGADAVAVVNLLPPNRDLTRSVGGLMRDMPGTCRVHLSSSEVYARRKDQYDLTERDMGKEGFIPCPYRAAERVLERATQGCLTVLRPGRLVGAAELAGPVLRWAVSGPLPLIRDGGVETSVLRVEELADAITHLIRAPAAGRARGAFNLASPRPMAVRDLAEKLCAGSGMTLRWRRVGRTGLRVGVLVRDLVRALPGGGGRRDEVGRLLGWSMTLDTSAFRRETGWVSKVPDRGA